MEKKQTQLQHRKSVRSKMGVKSKKPGKNLATASKSKSLTSNQHRFIIEKVPKFAKYVSK